MRKDQIGLYIKGRDYGSLALSEIYPQENRGFCNLNWYGDNLD